MKYLILLLAAMSANAQLFGPPTRFREVTVSTLPASPSAGYTVIVTDSSDGTCASGGGSSRVWCRYSGSGWDSVGDGNSGGGGGGTIATQTQAEAGTSNTVYMSPLRASQAAKAFWPFAPSRETGSSTNDTIRLNCDLSVACFVLSESIPAYSRTSDITMRVSGASGSGTAYIYYTPSTGVVYCDENTSATLTLSGCTAATTGGVPAGSIPLGRYDGAYTFDASNVFADPTGVAFTGNPSITSVVSGDGVSVTRNNTTGQMTVARDSAVVPSKSDFASNGVTYAATGGTSTAYTLTTPATIGAANTDGTCVWGRANNTSGSGPTLQVNAETARPIWKHQGTTAAAAIASGEIVSGQNYQFCYDSSLNTTGAWVVQNPGVAASASSSGYTYWLPLAGNNAGSAHLCCGWNLRGTTYVSMTYVGSDGGLPVQAVFTSTLYDSSVINIPIMIPSSYTSGNVELKLHWVVGSGSTAGQVVRYYVQTRRIGAGENLNADTYNANANVDGTATSGTNGTLDVATLSSLNLDSAVAGDILKIGINRKGSDAADTLAGSAGLWAVSIKFP